MARAGSVELTPSYEESAAELLREAGLEDRVERMVMDFANAGAEIAAADIVVMNRVICCYPDRVALKASPVSALSAQVELVAALEGA